MPRSWRNVFQYGFTCRLSLSFNPSLSLSDHSFFFHPASFSLIAHTCQEKGCGTAATARVGPCRFNQGQITMFCLQYTIPTLRQPTCPNHTTASSLVLVLLGEKKLFVMCFSAPSRSRYCPNASTLERETPKTVLIVSLRIFLLPQWVCN